MMKLADFALRVPDKESPTTAICEPQAAADGMVEHARDFAGGQCATLEELFRSIVANKPDAPALAGGTSALRFGELDVFSERIARFILARGYGRAVDVFEPPLPIPGFAVFSSWHSRRHRDLAHVWLRERLAEAAASTG